MENPEKKEDGTQKKGPENLENLSGDEILDKINQDASESLSGHDAQPSESEGLLGKLGISKKEKLKKENEELKLKIEEYHDKYLRLHAEFDNFKKRSSRERLDWIKTAGVEVIASLLPVLDDFKRALKLMETADDPQTEGVRLIYTKLKTILEQKGLKEMKALGEPFSPELHEAITEVTAPEEEQKGKVMDEIESGYYLHDKIIRHARVVVGK